MEWLTYLIVILVILLVVGGIFAGLTNSAIMLIILKMFAI